MAFYFFFFFGYVVAIFICHLNKSIISITKKLKNYNTYNSYSLLLLVTNVIQKECLLFKKLLISEELYKKSWC